MCFPSVLLVACIPGSAVSLRFDWSRYLSIRPCVQGIESSHLRFLLKVFLNSKCLMKSEAFLEICSSIKYFLVLRFGFINPQPSFEPCLGYTGKLCYCFSYAACDCCLHHCWERGCAADAVPLFPVSWYSFCQARKDDGLSQHTLCC